MKKSLLLLLLPFYVLAQTQSNTSVYTVATKTTNINSVTPNKSPLFSLKDSTTGKSPITTIQTKRLKLPKIATSTDTALYTKVLAVSGDSVAFIPKSYFGGGGSGGSCIPLAGADNITGNLLFYSDGTTRYLGIGDGTSSDNANISFQDNGTSKTATQYTSSSNGFESKVQSVSTTTESVTFNQVYNPNSGQLKGILLDTRIPVKIYGDYARGDSVYRDSDSLRYIQLKDAEERFAPMAGTQSTSLPDGQIWIGDGTNTAFPRALSLNAVGGTFGLSNTGVLTMPDATTSVRGLLSNSDYTNILGTKTASYAYLAPLTGGQALFRYIRKQDLENQYDKLGNIITSNWSSLTGWSNYGSATITVASNELVLNNASGTLDFTSGTENTAYGNSNLDKSTTSLPIRVGTINSTNFGVGINFKSNHGTAGSKRSVGVRVGFDTGNVGRLYFYQSDGTGVLLNTNAKSSNLPTASISAGDALVLKTVFYRNTYIATLYKGNKAINSLTYIIPSTIPLNVDFLRQNCWRYAIQSYGGVNYITTGYTVRADDAKSSPIMYIGDSLTWGQGSTSTSNTFASIINELSDSECTIYASPGNRTDEIVVSEILALQPRLIFMTIGTNNITKGDIPAAFAAKYATLVNALISGGYTVGVNLFLSTIPPFSTDPSSYNTEIVNYIASLSSPNINTYFDAFALLRNGTLTTLPANYTDDGTHLTDIAQTVWAKGVYGYMADFLPYSSVKKSDQIPLFKDTYGNALIGGSGGTKSLVRFQVAGDQTGPSTPSLFQVTDNPNTGGVYIAGSAAGGGLIGFNSQFNGAAHIPYATTTSNIQAFSGEINIFGNSGLTVGTGYALTKKFTTGVNGTIAYGDNTGGNTQFSVRDNVGSNNGMYMTAIIGAGTLSNGVERVGGSWIVRNPDLTALGGSLGVQIFYSATGQTVGSAIALGSFEKLRFDATGNILLGQALTPASLTKGIVVGTGVAPSASVVDSYVNYSADISAGNATQFIRSEGGEIASLGSEFGMQSNHALNLTTNSTVRASIGASGGLFVGGGTTPTALLHLGAGTAAANTAPLKFTSGTNLTTKENGAVEYNGNVLQYTANSVRYENGQLSGSVSATGTATTTFTVTIGQTQPNTTYKPFITAQNALSATMFYISNKTTTTFDVVFVTGLTGTVAFDWKLIP